MTQITFDAGIFIILLIISFLPCIFYKKIGSILFVVSVLGFLISGLIILTGEDVAFFKITNPANVVVTTTALNGTSTTVTTILYPQNETDYLIGNGTFPITGLGQLWMGFTFLTLALIFGAILVDQAIKGRLFGEDFL